jgi:hypothetical protein
VVPDIYNANTIPHILDSIFKWTYLCCCRGYIEYSMCVIVQIWCQIQHTPSSLRYMNYDPGHIQCTCSSTYSGFNTAECFSASIGDISTIQCPLYCKHGAKYCAHSSVYSVWTVVPAIYSVIAAPHIQASTFNWTNLRCYWNYVDNSASVILQSWCQYSAHPPVYAIWTVVPAIYSTITAPYIQASILNWAYLRCHCWYIDIQCLLYCKRGTKYSAHRPVDAIWPVVPDIYNENTVSHILASIFKWTYFRRYCRYVENSMRLILQTLCQILRMSSWLRYLSCVPGHIQYN